MSNKQPYYEYLIIGQGLAGSILALHLIDMGKRVLVLDNAHASSSSMVAAGMVNPIAGRRLAKSWKLDEALPYARTFYKSCECFTQTPCFFSRTIHRLLKNDEEVDKLQSRIHDPGYTPYLGQVHAALTLKYTQADTLGSVDILQGGYLAVSDFLVKARTRLEDQHAYQNTLFDYDLLKLCSNHIHYKNFTARHIVFCEGWKGQDNPWFRWLPFNSAKGDILTLQTPYKAIEKVFNQRKWILPLENNQLKVGATYTRNVLNNTPEASAKIELIEAFKSLLPDIHDYQVDNHQAGVRPLTIDNHPFVGRHPEHPQLSIFNGFGSKGVLFIPLLANHFAQHLEQDTHIWNESNIQRFWQFSSSTCS